MKRTIYNSRKRKRHWLCTRRDRQHAVLFGPREEVAAVKEFAQMAAAGDTVKSAEEDPFGAKAMSENNFGQV